MRYLERTLLTRGFREAEAPYSFAGLITPEDAVFISGEDSFVIEDGFSTRETVNPPPAFLTRFEVNLTIKEPQEKFS